MVKASAKRRLMVVDDEESMREFLCIMLGKEGYDVVGFSSGERAVEYFKANPTELVITDMSMPGMDGLELLKTLKEISPEVIVIIITAYASVDTAIEAMKAGAYDYFTKPFNVDDINIHIKRALEWRRLEVENALLKKDFQSKYGFDNLIGASPPMVEVYDLIKSVAGTKTNVLIVGQSGTGKELVAKAVHNESPRRDKPFVTINCGAIPENLLESELFGHRKGAFTGAIANKTGLAEMADGGTLFLDEITELPLNLQVKLLRFIQDRTVRSVGATDERSVDIRLIAATNRDVEEEVSKGSFREDLFYRLNVIRIDLPPLSARGEDIISLAKYFLNKYNSEHGKSVKNLSDEAAELLLGYGYPGNVRELENAIERAVAIESGESLSAESLPPTITGMGGSKSTDKAETDNESPIKEIPPEGVDLEGILFDYERRIVEEALKASGGVKKKAAVLLGISFRSLRYKLAKYEEEDDGKAMIK